MAHPSGVCMGTMWWTSVPTFPHRSHLCPWSTAYWSAVMRQGRDR